MKIFVVIPAGWWHNLFMASWVREPAARRKTLALTAGVVWLAVGTLLTAAALVWLSTGTSVEYLLAAAGLIAGLAVGKYGLSRIVYKNVERIKSLSPAKERICIFAFQAIQSYVLVIVMMAMGYTLRHLPVPHSVIALIYMTIGVALIKSGVNYLSAARAF